jgi:hypothetical protein
MPALALEEQINNLLSRGPGMSLGLALKPFEEAGVVIEVGFDEDRDKKLELTPAAPDGFRLFVHKINIPFELVNDCPTSEGLWPCFNLTFSLWLSSWPPSLPGDAFRLLGRPLEADTVPSASCRDVMLGRRFGIGCSSKFPYSSLIKDSSML